MTLVETQNLCKSFPIRRGLFGRSREFVHAVKNCSLSIERGETLGLVGESGSGKSTLGRMILGLMRPTSGEVIFDGQNIRSADTNKLKNIRRRMQIVFQDPFSSLNPRMTIGDIITEPQILHHVINKGERIASAVALLETVGLRADYARRYPHEFSGGQRQRICIARAISASPDFIVCDEPVSSLDVAIQAEILALFTDLKARLNVSYLFISHDLRIVSKMCDRVAVMCRGEIVEMLAANKIRDARHPYTKQLLDAVLVADPTARRKNES